MILAYSRISTMDQNVESISEQLKRCKAIAGMRGPTGKYDYREFSDRGVSGSIPLYKRPGGRSLLEHAGRGDCIIAAKLDRIFRSASDALSTVERLKKKGVGLIICDMGIDPVGESPATQMFFSMLSIVAQFERERISERVREGKSAKKARGGHIGGATPYGYRKLGAGRQAVLVRDDKEQGHIALARRMLSERPPGAYAPYARVARLMAAEGAVGRNGQTYSELAIMRMVRRKTVYGMDLVRPLRADEEVPVDYVITPEMSGQEMVQ